MSRKLETFYQKARSWAAKKNYMVHQLFLDLL